MEVKNSVYFEHNRKEQKVYYALMAFPLICNMNATQFLHREMYSNIFFLIHSTAFVVDINNTIQLLYSLIINSATEYIADFIDGKTLVTFHDLLSCLHASWSIIINVYYDA